MAQPITVTDGICFAFPDVCQTPSPSGTVPIPYPNIAQLSNATDTASTVKAGGKPVVTEASSVLRSSGDEAGTGGPGPMGKCTFTTFSKTVKANGKGIVRLGDSASQNGGNAVGTVLGGLPTVLVGG
jgi:hypothetical protein